MNLYLIRHGQTDWNVAGKIQGKTDIPLNETGKRQAACLARGMEKQPVVQIYTSSLKRALETAEIIGRRQNVKVKPMKELEEVGFGQWEGCTNEEIKRQYPQAQVYCCTLLPMGDWGTTEAQPFVPFVNGQNVTSEAYSERIRLIAGNRGLPIIDLEKCGITIDNMAEMTADGVHPTAEGMRLIADTVKKCLTE